MSTEVQPEVQPEAQPEVQPEVQPEAQPEAQPEVAVRVDPDHMKAWLCAVPDASAPGKPDRAAILAALEQAQVHCDDAVLQRVDDFLKQTSESPAAAPESEPSEGAPFLVAEGRTAVEGEDGQFIWEASLERNQPEDADEAVDYRTVHKIRTVKEGAVVGQIIAPQPSVAGIDVRGQTIKPKSQPRAVKLVSNVTASTDDGRSVIADVAGQVIYKDYKLSVREVVVIAGDVDYDSGNVDATINVNVQGTVRDLFEVKSEKSIQVGGAIEGAVVQAGEDVIVRGGILGRNRGRVVAGDQVATKFCDEADVHAQGDIEILNEAINSKLHTLGTLHCGRAAIIGGQTYARNGIDARTLGSEACVATRIAVGVPLTVFKRAVEFEIQAKKQQQVVDKIRDTVRPLLANIKRLNAQQKEKATELLYQAEEIENDIAKRQTTQEELLESSRPENPAYVKVQNVIHQNVVLSIDSREVHFNKEHKGPLRIEARKVKNVTELVVVNLLTGSITTLNSTPCDLSGVDDEPGETEPESAAGP